MDQPWILLKKNECKYRYHMCFRNLTPQKNELVWYRYPYRLACLLDLLIHVHKLSLCQTFMLLSAVPVLPYILRSFFRLLSLTSRSWLVARFVWCFMKKSNKSIQTFGGLFFWQGRGGGKRGVFPHCIYCQSQEGSRIINRANFLDLQNCRCPPLVFSFCLCRSFVQSFCLSFSLISVSFTFFVIGILFYMIKMTHRGGAQLVYFLLYFCAFALLLYR